MDGFLNLQNSQITNANPQATPEEYIDNLKTIIVLKKRGFIKTLI